MLNPTVSLVHALVERYALFTNNIQNALDLRTQHMIPNPNTTRLRFPAKIGGKRLQTRIQSATGKCVFNLLSPAARCDHHREELNDERLVPKLARRSGGCYGLERHRACRTNTRGPGSPGRAYCYVVLLASAAYLERVVSSSMVMPIITACSGSIPAATSTSM